MAPKQSYWWVNDGWRLCLLSSYIACVGVHPRWTMFLSSISFGQLLNKQCAMHTDELMMGENLRTSHVLLYWHPPSHYSVKILIVTCNSGPVVTALSCMFEWYPPSHININMWICLPLFAFSCMYRWMLRIHPHSSFDCVGDLLILACTSTE